MHVPANSISGRNERNGSRMYLSREIDVSSIEPVMGNRGVGWGICTCMYSGSRLSTYHEPIILNGKGNLTTLQVTSVMPLISDTHVTIKAQRISAISLSLPAICQVY